MGCRRIGTLIFGVEIQALIFGICSMKFSRFATGEGSRNGCLDS